MQEDRIRKLRASSSFHKAPAVAKLLRAPARILFVRWAGWRGRRAGVTYPVRARLFWGDEMDVLLPDPVSAVIYAYGHYEADLSEFLLRFLQRGAVALDVGAHLGYYSLLMSSLVGPEGMVHAFEPTPRTFDLLQANVSGRSNVRVNRAAVWKEDTTLELRDFGSSLATFNSVSGARLDETVAAGVREVTFRVPAITLDSYLDSVGGQVDFLKIDAENAEAEVLRGMDRILETHRPVYSLEVGDLGPGSTGRSRALLEAATTKGYLALDLVRGTLVRHERRERYGYGNVILVPEERAEEVLKLYSRDCG